MAPHPAQPRSTRPSASRWAEQLGRIFERVAVLALNGTSAEVVAVHGISHAALGVTLSLVERTPLRWAIEAASPVVGSGKSPGGSGVAIALGMSPPRGYVVVPLAMPGGIVGLAYADRGPRALSLSDVNAAFGFCQTVLTGAAVPTARRPRTYGRHAARAGRSWARRGPGPLARLADPEIAPSPGAEERPAGTGPATADEPPSLDRSLPAAAPAARFAPLADRSDTGAPPALAPAPPSRGLGPADDLDPDGPDADVALFTSYVQASLAELRRASPPADDDLPLVEDEVVIGADELRASAWNQSWAAREAISGGDRTAGAGAAGAPAQADAPAHDAPAVGAPAPAEPPTATAVPPPAAGPGLPARSAPVDAPPAAFAAKAAPAAAAASPSEPAPMARAVRPVLARPVVARMFVAPQPGSGFVGGPTLYAQQVAVVTPGGVVPLADVRRRGTVARAVTTTAAAIATVAALLLALVAPASHPDSPPRSIVISPQASLASIARELEAEGLVRNAAGFAWLARLSGADRALRAGTFRLSPGAWAWQQLHALTGGQVDTVSITVPEGLTLQEVAKLVEERRLGRADDFLAAARAPDLLARYDLPGPTAEGYLFPETYSFAAGVSAREIVDAMVRQFFARVSTIPEGAAASRDDLARKVVLASIIEREARDKSERPRIAGVFQNRLDRGMRLESCATVQYVLGRPKEKLTVADVRRSSPYNTYLHPGLPPAPISNPGLEALRSAFEPERHELLFFFAREDGTHRHVFSRTYAEHMSAQRLVASREKPVRKAE